MFDIIMSNLYISMITARILSYSYLHTYWHDKCFTLVLFFATHGDSPHELRGDRPCEVCHTWGQTP